MGSGAADNKSGAQKTWRRAKGDGGLIMRADGWARGYKAINGKRVYTRWMPSQLLARDAIKYLSAPDPGKSKQKHIVGDSIAAWLDASVHASSTRGGYEQSARHYLKELLDIPVAELERVTVTKHYRQMALKKGLSQSTIRQAAAVLRGGLGYAYDNGWATSNAAYGVRIPPAPKAQVEGIGEADRSAVLAAVKGHRYEARWRLGILFAVRPGEVTGLSWDNVSVAEGWVDIRQQLQRSKVGVEGVNLGTIMRGKAKTARGTRRIWPDAKTMRLLEQWHDEQAQEAAERVQTPFSIEREAAQAARLTAAKRQGLLGQADLYTLPSDHDLVFTLANGDPILPRWDADMWNAILEKAGVEHTRIYSMRHTAINFQLLAGAPIEAVSVGAGHGTTGFTERAYGGNRDALGFGLAAFVGDD